MTLFNLTIQMKAIEQNLLACVTIVIEIRHSQEIDGFIVFFFIFLKNRENLKSLTVAFSFRCNQCKCIFLPTIPLIHALWQLRTNI